MLGFAHKYPLDAEPTTGTSRNAWEPIDGLNISQLPVVAMFRPCPVLRQLLHQHTHGPFTPPSPPATSTQYPTPAASKQPRHQESGGFGFPRQQRWLKVCHSPERDLRALGIHQQAVPGPREAVLIQGHPTLLSQAGVTGVLCGRHLPHAVRAGEYLRDAAEGVQQPPKKLHLPRAPGGFPRGKGCHWLRPAPALPRTV